MEVLELNNPTDAVITTSLCTVAAARGLHAPERPATIPDGTAMTTSDKRIEFHSIHC